MLYRYFKYSRKRIAVFCTIIFFLFLIQFILTGSMVSRQQVITEAGTANSSVIGIIDNEEVIRQKFVFDRKVVLSQFTLSFGSFERSKVGKTLHLQMTDGDNNLVYNGDVSVSEINPNQPYTVEMDHTVTIPKGVVCCLKITSSSKNSQYALIPTLNTTNRTDPNTYMSTLKMQTRKKSLNISYTYWYRQFYPLVILILEFVIIFVICFEGVTDKAAVYRKRRQKMLRRNEKEKSRHEEAVKNKLSKKMHDEKNAALKNTSPKKDRHVKKSESKGERKRRNRRRRQFGFYEFCKWCIAEPKVERYVSRAIWILNPLVLTFMLETMSGNLLKMYAGVWPFTWILLMGIELLLYAIIGNISAASISMDIVLFIAGLANLFIMNVRGTPFLPADILGVTTATEVADHYTLSLTPAQFVMLPAFIIWCMLLVRFHKKAVNLSLQKKVRRRLVPLVSGIAIFAILYNTSVLEACGIKDNVWNKVASCRANGFYMNYFINLHYLKVSEPSGYSQDKVVKIAEEVKNDTSLNSDNNVNVVNPDKTVYSNSDYKTTKTLNGKKPNIILIMNESLADFSKVGSVNFNKDPLEYIHSLKENTVSGLDYVSVFGAGTSNSEFEAMTGNTMSFFPSGSNVYQQFMHDTTFSISSYLKSLGYLSYAVHPSSGNNWNRINTYKSMKFDKFITIDDFKNPEYVRYISDKESYKKVIELYEKKDKSEPMFVFDMTIQNHGGYLTNTNWDDPVYVEGKYYTEAKEYLSSTKVSDDAFKYLIEYFKKADEPTIICMFGDHHPSIETAFYEDLLGKSQSEWELDDIQKRYATPFIMWANYDIQEGKDIVLGNNNVENMLLKGAGLELPLYNKFVEKVSEEIPVLNVNGYMDNQGKWHKYDTDETDKIKKLLEDYEILQYGYYNDTDKQKMADLFGMK